jgi:hypothetical protein
MMSAEEPDVRQNMCAREAVSAETGCCSMPAEEGDKATLARDAASCRDRAEIMRLQAASEPRWRLAPRGAAEDVPDVRGGVRVGGEVAQVEAGGVQDLVAVRE